MVPAWAYEENRLSVEDVAANMLFPHHCDDLYGPVPPSMEYQRKFDLRYFSLLATWLHLAGKELEYAPVPTRVLSAAEVEHILDEFRRCELAGT